MVSPGNVLKPRAGMAAFAERLQGARRLADGRRIIATGIEAALGTRYSIDTVRALRRRFPRAKFVWIMGADILEQMPRWRSWRKFAALVPFAVLPRGDRNLAALSGFAARAPASLRPARAAPVLADAGPPAHVILNVPRHPASASAIRARRQGAEP